MRRLVASTLTVGAVAISGCGAAGTAPSGAGSTAAVARGAPASAACTAAVRSEIVDVVRRVYDQAVSGRGVTESRRRLARSTALSGAVAARDPRAVASALRPLLKHQIKRIEIRAAGRTLATVGRAPALAPARGVITHRGRVVGTYVLAVSEVRPFRDLIDGLTGARVRFGHPEGSRAGASLPAVRYPAGATRLWVTPPAVHTSLCGTSRADTRLRTIGLVARDVMSGEAHSPATARAVRHVAQDPAFRRAVAARDPAAVRAAIVTFFGDDRFHIVRVRAWAGGRLIDDVGGPFVLSPATGTVRGPDGASVASFALAIQDDTGLIKLVHEFTGAAVVLHTSTGTVPGSSLMPGPPFRPGLSSVRYGGHTYRAYGLTGTTFPTGTLQVSVLVR